MNYRRKLFCRCCLSRDLYQYLDLGRQPLANSYHKRINPPVAPLKVNLCKSCFHSQLSVVVNPDSMFRNYLYVSGTTQTFRNHTKELAKDAVKRFKNKKLTVLDIACNDGTQLEFFRELGCRVYGVDPARNLRTLTKKKKIDVAVEYWTLRLAKRFKEKFDIITATNVFAHVDDVDEFLEASRVALKKDGVLIIEFPYAVNMIKHNEFDTIYHEHLSYFLVSSFKRLTDRLNFTISDVLTTKIHGGSIRFFLRKNQLSESPKIKSLIAKEKSTGLYSVKRYRKFSEDVAKNKRGMTKLSKKIKKDNQKLIGYGASAKGNTMLNYFKLDLDYTVDDNPLKWGYMTPGTNVPIKSPNEMTKEKDGLYIVILAWNFYNEISKRISQIRGNQNDFAVLYIPRIGVRKIKGKKIFKQSA